MRIVEFDPMAGFYHFRAASVEAGRHSHPAGEIVLAHSGTFDLVTPQGCFRHLKAVLLPANLEHELLAGDADLSLVFFEPPSGITVPPAGAQNMGGAWLIDYPEGDKWQTDNLRDQHTAFRPPGGYDERILHCLRALNERSREPELSTDVLAATFHLSPGRLAHLFKEQIGVSVPQYLLWARTRDAVRGFLAGEGRLQTVALNAGFYDPAHFSRAFRRFFGTPPSFAYNSDSVQDSGK